MLTETFAWSSSCWKWEANSNKVLSCHFTVNLSSGYYNVKFEPTSLLHNFFLMPVSTVVNWFLFLSRSLKTIWIVIYFQSCKYCRYRLLIFNLFSQLCSSLGEVASWIERSSILLFHIFPIWCCDSGWVSLSWNGMFCSACESNLLIFNFWKLPYPSQPFQGFVIS